MIASVQSQVSESINSKNKKVSETVAGIT